MTWLFRRIAVAGEVGWFDWIAASLRSSQ